MNTIDIYDLQLIFSDYIMDCNNFYLSTRAKKFEKLSYKKWAVDTIFNEIYVLAYPRNKCPEIEIEKIVEDFAKRMAAYSYRNKKSSIIFVSAFDVAIDILDILRSMKGDLL